MIRRMTMALAAIFTLALVFSSVVRAHEGHDHKIMGTVTMAAADHVMLKDTDGKDVMVNVVHASDSLDNARIELKRFFRDGEVF